MQIRGLNSQNRMNRRIILSSKQLKVTCADSNQGDEYNHVDILSTNASEYLVQYFHFRKLNDKRLLI